VSGEARRFIPYEHQKFELGILPKTARSPSLEFPEMCETNCIMTVTIYYHRDPRSIGSCAEKGFCNRKESRQKLKHIWYTRETLFSECSSFFLFRLS
jgi:hypothetical protein